MSKFIPKPYKKEPITIRMSSEKIEQIDRLSAEFNLLQCEIFRMFQINKQFKSANVPRTIRFTESLFADLNKVAQENHIS